MHNKALHPGHAMQRNQDDSNHKLSRFTMMHKHSYFLSIHPEQVHFCQASCDLRLCSSMNTFAVLNYVNSTCVHTLHNIASQPRLNGENRFNEENLP